MSQYRIHKDVYSILEYVLPFWNSVDLRFRFLEAPKVRLNIAGIVTHVGKYDRADDRPKLAMLAANVGYRYWTDDRSRLG